MKIIFEILDLLPSIGIMLLTILLFDFIILQTIIHKIRGKYFYTLDILSLISTIFIFFVESTVLQIIIYVLTTIALFIIRFPITAYMRKKESIDLTYYGWFHGH